jgi:hypothetical protein
MEISHCGRRVCQGSTTFNAQRPDFSKIEATQLNHSFLVNPTMAAAYKIAEGAIQKALHAYNERKRENPQATLSEITKEFDVSY